MKKYITKNYKQTQKLGQNLAKEILQFPTQKKAIVILLYGDLGGGKTTFLQGFAKGLGVKEKVLSPTFVIMKKFSIAKNITSHKSSDRHIYAIRSFLNFYHIDAYRLQNYKDAQELGLKELFKDPENIIAIEWPERIKKILPKNVIKMNFKFVSNKEREVLINLKR